MTPEVSVIIAAYNVEHYIERAIQSVLDQKGVTLEIIVVDDASTDNTWNILSKLNDPRIRPIQLPVNSGPSVARNQGISLGKYPWIAILDGDDMFLPGRLLRLIHKAVSNQSDVIVDNLRVYREEDGQQSTMYTSKQLGNDPILTLTKFILGNIYMFSTSSLGYFKPIISSKFLKKHNLQYDTNIRIGEDYMLLSELLVNGAKCIIESEPGYRYTVRKGSISHRLKELDINRVLTGDKKFIKKYKLVGSAKWAQMWRTFGLKDALYFSKLVEAIKQRDYLNILKIVISRPTAALHLWYPLWMRIMPLLKNNTK